MIITNSFKLFSKLKRKLLSHLWKYRGKIFEILSKNVRGPLSRSTLFNQNLRAVPSEISEIESSINQCKGKFSNRLEFLVKAEKHK